MDPQRLLLHPNLHLVAGGMPPPITTYCRYRRRLAALRIACALSTNYLAAARLPASFPSLSAFRAQDSSRHLTSGLSSVYLPLDSRTLVLSPPIRKHLPIDALAHLMRPLQEGLRRFPHVLHSPLPTGSNIPPAHLMACSHHVLRTRAKNMLIKDWTTDAPPPLLQPPLLPIPAPLYGPWEIRGRENVPDARHQKLPCGPPLLVRRRT